MKLLQLKNVTKQFGGLMAVDNVSFDVERGSIFGIIGPNGAGKTTIFNLITGIYKVTEGEILFEGIETNSMQPYRVAELG
ncbi:MAG TPA: ATP-binding cassette domain-containing protein, partial [Bacillota bacterium]|nr:ATP-binding cassette domain-containing protein [Bacillota bacterium]